MYGTNGAVLLDEKAYWDSAASKGIDELYKSVWECKKGDNGEMPAKGFCNLCSEDEIRKSVLYLLNKFWIIQLIIISKDMKIKIMFILSFKNAPLLFIV